MEPPNGIYSFHIYYEYHKYKNVYMCCCVSIVYVSSVQLLQMSYDTVLSDLLYSFNTVDSISAHFISRTVQYSTVQYRKQNKKKTKQNY